jgi:hypothetical protein
VVDVDIRKPLAEDTAARLAETLKGQGPPRPEPGKPVLKPSERLALVVTYNPAHRRAVSPEIKQFLNSRPGRRPGTVQLFLVVSGSRQ